MSSTTWRVSFSEPASVDARRRTEHGLDRQIPAVAVLAGSFTGSASCAGVATEGAAGAAGTSSSSRFSMRLVSLPPGTQRLSLVSVPAAMAAE